MLGRLKDLTMNMDRSQNLVLIVHEDFRETFEKLKNENVDIQIKKASKARSMDANAYFWHLCGEIAKSSSKYSTDGKNEVYREAIRAKGEYEPLLVREQAVDYFIAKWGQRGLGWFADVIDDYVGNPQDFDDIMGDTVDRYKVVHAYYGSSTYSATSMSRIIDYVIHIANDNGIPTMTENKKQELLQVWSKKTGGDSDG